MTSLALTLLERAQLLATFHRYFDLCGLTDPYGELERAAFQHLRDDIAILVMSGSPVDTWDLALCSRFLATACRVGQEALAHLSPTTPDDDKDMQIAHERADWLCSFAAAAGGRVSAAAKLQACGLWARSRLAAGALGDDPNAFVKAAVSLLMPLGVPVDNVIDFVKLQIILHAGRRAAAESADTRHLGTARSWCQELAGREYLRPLLTEAPAILGVAFLEPDEQWRDDSEPTRAGEPGGATPLHVAASPAETGVVGWKPRVVHEQRAEVPAAPTAADWQPQVGHDPLADGASAGSAASAVKRFDSRQKIAADTSGQLDESPAAELAQPDACETSSHSSSQMCATGFSSRLPAG
jgi:hypothetical protein